MLMPLTVCPVKVCSSVPVPASHNRIVPPIRLGLPLRIGRSALAVAIVFLFETEGYHISGESVSKCSCVGIPQPNRLIPIRTCDCVSIGTE